MKRYIDGCKGALFRGWFDWVKIDSVCGNGFTIFLYGLKLIFIYMFCFVIRLLIAVLFPITAFMVIKFDDDHEKRMEQIGEDEW